MRAPAVLGAVREQHLVSPIAGKLISTPIPLQEQVQSGQLAAQLHAPDLEQRRMQSLPSATVSKWMATQQTFNEELLNQGQAVQKRLQGDVTILRGLKDELDRLQLKAPFDGRLVYWNEDVMRGGWVAPREWLASVADLSQNRIDVYPEEKDLQRIALGNSARFIPDAIEYGSFSCKVAEIDRVSTASLDDPSLASAYGGPIPAQPDTRHEFVPIVPRYRVRLDHCNPAAVPPLRLRGVAHLQATRQSPALELMRHAWITLIRETGL